MDQALKYHETIKAVLTRYCNLDRQQPSPGVESFVLFDDAQEQYIWLQVGWDRTGRTCGNTVYIRLNQGQVWIEEDLTEDGIMGDLLAEGIPETDIVLGFQHPSDRGLADISVA